MNSKMSVIAREARMAVDHLLLGIADLHRGIEWMIEKTGVIAAPGGSHPGIGTQNALLSLGNLQYIEILALDPTQQQRGRLGSLVQNLTVPQWITWAASTESVDGIARKAQAAGYAIDGPSDGERIKPDGGILKWRTVRIISEFGDVIPFFIEWGSGTKHPSHDAPPGCNLLEFGMEHPDPDGVRNVLSQFGISAPINHGIKPRLRAVLSTPKGNIEL